MVDRRFIAFDVKSEVKVEVKSEVKTEGVTKIAKADRTVNTDAKSRVNLVDSQPISEPMTQSPVKQPPEVVDLS
jgi:hypothetical protein